MTRSFAVRAGVVGTALGAMLGVTAMPAMAANGVTQNVTQGVLSASVGDLSLADVVYSNSSQTSAGSMVLSADDSTGNAAGWNVTLQTSTFAYSGTHSGTALPASSFAITSISQPTLVSGQAVDVTAATGPEIPPTSPIGTLDSARAVVSATAAYGTGTYTQGIGVTLTIPAGSKIGNYAGTLTTTIVAGP